MRVTCRRPLWMNEPHTQALRGVSEEFSVVLRLIVVAIIATFTGIAALVTFVALSKRRDR